MSFLRTSPLRLLDDLVEGHDSYLHCPICGVVIHSCNSHNVVDPTALADDSEIAATLHMATEHPLRYWLWRKTGWKRALLGLIG